MAGSTLILFFAAHAIVDGEPMVGWAPWSRRLAR